MDAVRESFPHFMDGVERIEQRTDAMTHRVTKIGGVTKEFEAEITEQILDERVALRTPGGEVKQAGGVTFHRLSDSRTKVMLQLDYDPDGFAENVGDKLGFVKRQITGDLKRFKDHIERRGQELLARHDLTTALPHPVDTCLHGTFRTYRSLEPGCTRCARGRRPRRTLRPATQDHPSSSPAEQCARRSGEPFPCRPCCPRSGTPSPPDRRNHWVGPELRWPAGHGDERVVFAPSPSGSGTVTRIQQAALPVYTDITYAPRAVGVILRCDRPPPR